MDTDPGTEGSRTGGNLENRLTFVEVPLLDPVEEGPEEDECISMVILVQ